MPNEECHPTVEPRGTQLYFYTNRSDGFGGRLMALMNAIVAAECFNGRMALEWPLLQDHLSESHHAILSASETFSPAYLLNHQIDQRAFESLTHSKIRDLDLTKAAQLSSMSEGNAVQVDTKILSIDLPGFFKLYPRSLYRDAFETIEFSERLSYAKDFSRRVNLSSPCVALHLRTGDIVYGRTRFIGGFPNKIAAFQVAEVAMKKFIANGMHVLVFGEEDNLCRRVANTVGASYVADIEGYKDLDRAQRVLFEICLMARCTEIVQGQSAFAIAASWIGQNKITSLPNLVTPREAIDATISLIESPVENLAPLQIAFSVYYTLAHFRNEMSEKERALCIETCVSNDQSNPFYGTMKAQNLYALGRHSQAEDCLLRAVTNNQEPFGFRWLWSTEGGINRVEEYLQVIEDAASMQQPVAALCLAFRNLHLGNSAEAQQYARIYFSNRGTIRTCLDDEIADLY